MAGKRKTRPSLTPQARENRMIAMATDLAEQQIMDGTASSQIITHYLKLGSSSERLNQRILETKQELMEAKTESLQSAKRIEALYEKALSAMQRYSGHQDDDVY